MEAMERATAMVMTEVMTRDIRTKHLSENS